MSTPYPHEPLGSSERERPSATKGTGPVLRPKDLTPHLRELAHSLRERPRTHGRTPHGGPV